MFGDVLHSVMFFFLFLYNILTMSAEAYSGSSQTSEMQLFLRK